MPVIRIGFHIRPSVRLLQRPFDGLHRLLDIDHDTFRSPGRTRADTDNIHPAVLRWLAHQRAPIGGANIKADYQFRFDTCATPGGVSQCMSGYCVIPITRNQTRIHHWRRCGVTLLITAVLSQNKGVFFRPVSQSEYPGYSIFSVKSSRKPLLSLLDILRFYNPDVAVGGPNFPCRLQPLPRRARSKGPNSADADWHPSPPAAMHSTRFLFSIKTSKPFGRAHPKTGNAGHVHRQVRA